MMRLGMVSFVGGTISTLSPLDKRRAGLRGERLALLIMLRLDALLKDSKLSKTGMLLPLLLDNRRRGLRGLAGVLLLMRLRCDE